MTDPSADLPQSGGPSMSDLPPPAPDPDQWRVQSEQLEGAEVTAVYHLPCGYKGTILPGSPTSVADLQAWHLSADHLLRSAPDPDRLPMIEANMVASRRTLRPPYITSDDADWLVGEVERLRRHVGEVREERHYFFEQAKRLRGLLERLEWAGGIDTGPGSGCVPCCPGCELAAVLHPANDQAPPTREG